MKKDILRMAEWLVVAGVLYGACFLLRAFDAAPQAQVVLWKLGNLTVAGHVGYWMDRRAFTRIMADSTVHEQLRRAIVIAAAMLSVALGL
jgi:Putative 2/3 transmembrane domain holin